MAARTPENEGARPSSRRMRCFATMIHEKITTLDRTEPPGNVRVGTYDSLLRVLTLFDGGRRTMIDGRAAVLSVDIHGCLGI